MGGHRGKPVWGKPRGPGVPAPLHTGRAAPRRPRTPRKGGGRRGTQWGRAHGLGPGQGAGRRPGARLPRLRPNKAARGAQPRAAARRGAGSFPPPYTPRAAPRAPSWEVGGPHGPGPSSGAGRGPGDSVGVLYRLAGRRAHPRGHTSAGQRGPSPRPRPAGLRAASPSSLARSPSLD